MKKIFCKVALCLSVLAMSTMFTSCDKDIVQTIINYLVGGETYTYTGTYYLQGYALDATTDAYTAVTEELEFEGTTVTATTRNTTAVSVDLTLPGTSIREDITMSDVQISNLGLNDVTLEAGNSTTVSGTLTYTVNGVSQTVNAHAFDVKASISTDELQIEYVDVYYGDDDSIVVRIKMPDGKAK